MINFDIIENVNYTKIGEMTLNTLPPRYTHIIVNDTEFEIIDYVLMDYDINTYKAVVKKTSSRDMEYKGRFW